MESSIIPPQLCSLNFVKLGTRTYNIIFFWSAHSLPAHIKKFKHRQLKNSNTAENKKPPKSRQNVGIVNIPAPLSLQTSRAKPGPLDKLQKMNSNAAKNQVSISAPKQPIRCLKTTGPLGPLGPLTGSKIFIQNRRRAARPRSRRH